MKDLANKYRPQILSDVVGQDTAKALLARRLEAGEPPQALMFSGPPGTGKTTMARIIAAGLNCENGPTAEPCGQCSSCKAARGQRHEFVLEINAGSDGGIEALRDLLAEMRRPIPTTAWRVVVIDEGQALTQAAQTALLKPLEEPSARCTIIFCTTAPQSLQPAIRSRCEPIQFKALGPAEISGLLEKVIAAEDLELQPETIGAIVDKSNGSPRSALKNLSLAAEDETTFELQGRQQVELLISRALKQVSQGDLAAAMLAGVMATRSCVTEFGSGAVVFQAMAEQLHNTLQIQLLHLQADELGLGEEAFGNLTRAADIPSQKLTAWIDLVWQAWDKADGALLKPEALATLTLCRMAKADGVAPAQSAPAPVQSKPKPAAVASGPLTQDSLVGAAASDPNLQSLLKRAELMSFEGGLLTLGSSSRMTRDRLSKQAGEVVELLAAHGVRELEVVK